MLCEHRWRGQESRELLSPELSLERGMRSESSALQLEVVAGQRPREKERGAPPRTEQRADAKQKGLY